MRAVNTQKAYLNSFFVALATFFFVSTTHSQELSCIGCDNANLSDSMKLALSLPEEERDYWLTEMGEIVEIFDRDLFSFCRMPIKDDGDESWGRDDLEWLHEDYDSGPMKLLSFYDVLFLKKCYDSMNSDNYESAVQKILRWSNSEYKWSGQSIKPAQSAIVNGVGPLLYIEAHGENSVFQTLEDYGKESELMIRETIGSFRTSSDFLKNFERRMEDAGPIALDLECGVSDSEICIEQFKKELLHPFLDKGLIERNYLASRAESNSEYLNEACHENLDVFACDELGVTELVREAAIKGCGDTNSSSAYMSCEFLLLEDMDFTLPLLREGCLKHRYEDTCETLSVVSFYGIRSEQDFETAALSYTVSGELMEEQGVRAGDEYLVDAWFSFADANRMERLYSNCYQNEILDDCLRIKARMYPTNTSTNLEAAPTPDKSVAEVSEFILNNLCDIGDAFSCFELAQFFATRQLLRSAPTDREDAFGSIRELISPIDENESWVYLNKGCELGHPGSCEILRRAYTGVDMFSYYKASSNSIRDDRRVVPEVPFHWPPGKDLTSAETLANSFAARACGLAVAIANNPNATSSVIETILGQQESSSSGEYTTRNIINASTIGPGPVAYAKRLCREAVRVEQCGVLAYEDRENENYLTTEFSDCRDSEKLGFIN